MCYLLLIDGKMWHVNFTIISITHELNEWNTVKWAHENIVNLETKWDTLLEY